MEGVLVPWIHGGSWAENPQQLFPFPAPDCSCLVLCQHLSLIGWLGLECSPGGHLLQIPAQAGLPRASCLGLCLDSFQMSLRMETSLGNLCSAWSLSQQKCFQILRWYLLHFSLSPVLLLLSHPVISTPSFWWALLTPLQLPGSVRHSWWSCGTATGTGSAWLEYASWLIQGKLQWKERSLLLSA